MTIRPATPADARAIAEVHVASSRAAYRDLLARSGRDVMSLEKRTPRWEQALKEGPATVLVGETNGAIAGFIHFGPTRDADVPGGAEVLSVYVRPEAWGTGVGPALLREALRRLAESGFRVVTLWSWEGNMRANRFYARAGFSPDGAETGEEHFGVRVRAVRYRRGLPS
jgi:ribosomal protein S18 acetylase RimI-like enzyme